jgi:UDP-N-acetylglucosamine 2-epimerase (non-hydrolysing)/GDP/UDP-N,N'-diacetylbacillosamine 2-epimerase (hydrolysing)
MSRRRICVVTGSRADYGLLYWPLKLLADSEEFELQIVVTGMHLSPAFGETWRQIESDGFTISARVESLVAGDSACSVSKSVGLGVIGFSDVIQCLRPDLLVVLGDRFEILAAVQAALFAKVPVAHLCGGDVTEGAFDESIRHAISKMAHIHFPSNADAGKRLMAMGENPDHVHIVGSPGLDRIRRMQFMPRDAFFELVGLRPGKQNLLVVLHPATLEDGVALDQTNNLLQALTAIGPDVGLLLTGANADTDGQIINTRLQTFASMTPNAVFKMSLGSELFINALKHVDAIVGNSSSGLYEAPSLGLPTVNIGNRQKGRLRAPSVIDVQSDPESIVSAVKRALSAGRAKPANPYGDGYAAEKILDTLRQIENLPSLVQKPFYGNMSSV